MDTTECRITRSMIKKILNEDELHTHSNINDQNKKERKKLNKHKTKKRKYTVTFDESESEEFTVVEDGVNNICDEMNKAVRDYDNWVPENKLQLRMKETIDRIERKYCKKGKNTI